MIDPGSHPRVINHPNGQRLAAEVDLGVGRSPQGRVLSWPLQERDGIRTLPQPAEPFPRLRCDLRMGREVLLLDATVEPWFPDQARLRAQLAVVGHGLSADPRRGFPEASVQITEGHRLFGRASVTKVTFPAELPETGKVQFGVEVDLDANVTYSSGETELRCRYWLTSSLTDYRRFHVTTAPVFELRNATPLTPTDWMASHVLPLHELVTLATLEPQTVAWVTVDEEHEGASTQASTRSYQLYSRDIWQAPYAPTADPHKEARTLFAFPSLPYSPVELLRRWEDLRTRRRGFIQPLMQGLTEQMNPRARFVFLVQALEGLHTGTAGEGPIPVTEHRAKRKAVLQAVKDVGLDRTQLSWLNRWIDRNGRFSLAERLTQLCDAVRTDIERVADVNLVPGEIPRFATGYLTVRRTIPGSFCVPQCKPCQQSEPPMCFACWTCRSTASRWFSAKPDARHVAALQTSSVATHNPSVRWTQLWMQSAFSCGQR